MNCPALFQAVCCSDHEHCCPNGYTCDTTGGKCNPNDPLMPSISWDIDEKLSSSPDLLSHDTPPSPNPICPDEKGSCSSNETCCLLNSGKYGCCGYANVRFVKLIPKFS